MKRGLASIALVVVAAALSGCYYDPGYSYVRPVRGGGDAYYGEASQPYYVAPAYSGGYYSDGYYNDGYYGCCYAPGVSIGIGSVWYGGSRYRGYRGYDRGHGYYRGGYGHDDHHHDGGDHGGHWNGQRHSVSHDHGHDNSHGHWQSSHHH